MELSERFIQTFENEGFLHVYEWQDVPGKVYPEHTHKGEVSVFVTDGSIAFETGGLMKLVSPGQRYNIPVNVPHSAVAGEAGAIYIVGEMIDGDSL